MRQFFLLLCFSTLLYLQAYTQTCGSVAYNSDDGLAAANYMSIFQDSRGILWVGSYGGGVSRFDGRHWENWTTRSGIFSNTVSNIFEDKEGGLWFDHGDQGCSRYKDSKWQNFDYHQDSCAKGSLCFDGFQNKVFIIETGWYDKKSTRLFEYDFKTRKFLPDEKCVLPENIATHYAGFDVLKGERENEWWVYANNKTLQFSDYYHVENGQIQKMPIPPGTFEFFARPIYSNSRSPETGEAIVQSAKGVFILKNKRWQNLLPPAIPRYAQLGFTPPLQFSGSSYDPGSNSLFVVWRLDEKSFEKRYLLAAYDITTLQLRQTVLFSNPFLDIISGRQIRKDAAGTIWIATSGNVLRLFPDRFYIPVTAQGMPSQVWGVAQTGDGGIWFASYGEGLARFDGLNIQQQPPGMFSKAFYNDGSLTDEKGNVYFNKASQENGILKFDGISHWDVLAGNLGVVGFFVTRGKKGQILWGTSEQGLWILREGKTGHSASDWFKIDHKKGLLLDNVLTALEDRHGRYWMGRTSQGIAMYDPKTDKVLNWLRTQDVKNFGCISMAEDARGNLWFGTDRGLCFFENRPDIRSDFDLQTNLLRVGLEFTGESTVMSCRIYDAHTLIIGNTTGLHLLDLDAFYGTPRRILFRGLNLKNGYQAGPVGQNTLSVDRDSRIWLTGGNGAFRYNPHVLPQDTTSPQVFIDSIKVGNNIFKNFSERFSLGNGQQFVQIYYHAQTNPMLFDNIRFEYRFTGDSTWVKTQPDAEFIRFQSLNAGTYCFEIRAVKEGIYSKPAVTYLSVPYWWQNPLLWLVLLVAAILAGLLFQKVKLLRAKQQIQIEKTKNESDKLIAEQKLQISDQQLRLEKSINEMAQLNKEKDKLQVQAIVNQLNPHFINNALQWLQLRIEEDEEAVRVVGKLSENISTVFKNSRIEKSYHSLREEMQLTQNYLYIQKCRFGDKLNYEMPEAETLRTLEHINVPLMIVQIHIENAVEHGIRNKTTGVGRVRISLREEEFYIVITVEDDGVGREAAAEIGSNGTQNGTLMLKELESIYNKQNRMPLEQFYQDNIFVDAKGKFYGTRIIVRMPKDYNFEF